MSHEGARQRPHPRTILKSEQGARRQMSRFPTHTKARRAALDRRALVRAGGRGTHAETRARASLRPPCACAGPPPAKPAPATGLAALLASRDSARAACMAHTGNADEAALIRSGLKLACPLIRPILSRRQGPLLRRSPPRVPSAFATGTLCLAVSAGREIGLNRIPPAGCRDAEPVRPREPHESS